MEHGLGIESLFKRCVCWHLSFGLRLCCLKTLRPARIAESVNRKTLLDLLGLKYKPFSKGLANERNESLVFCMDHERD